MSATPAPKTDVVGMNIQAMIENAAVASQNKSLIDDQVTREAIELNIVAPITRRVSEALEAVWKYSLVIESSVRRGDGPEQYAGVVEALRLIKEARAALAATEGRS